MGNSDNLFMYASQHRLISNLVLVKPFSLLERASTSKKSFWKVIFKGKVAYALYYTDWNR